MKCYKLSIILIISFAFSYAQEVVKGENGEAYIILNCRHVKRLKLDTLAYLKQFEANKANYINQPLSVLLNDMTQIQPKTAWSFPMNRVKIFSPNTRFNFDHKELSFRRTPTLLIEWQSPIPRDQTKYYEQKNAFYFTNEERIFYGSKIIKDIIVYK